MLVLSPHPRKIEAGDGIIRNGLRARWKLDEGSGQTAVDETGNGWDATLQNGPSSWVADGPFGNTAIRWSGSVSQYGRVTQATSGNPIYTMAEAAATGVTITGWIRMHDPNSNPRSAVYHSSTTDSATARLALQLERVTTTRTKFEGLSYAPGPIVVSPSSSSYPVDAGIWTFGAVILDPFKGTVGKLELYHNATLAGSADWDANNQAGEPVYVVLGAEKNIKFCDGDQSDTRLYMRVLSVAELEQIRDNSG